MAGGRKRSKEASSEDKPQSKKAKPDSDSASGSDEEAGASDGSTKQPDKGIHVNPTRYRELRGGEIKKGPVIYW